MYIPFFRPASHSKSSQTLSGKTGFLGRLRRCKRRVVTGGRRLKRALSRLVNAQDAAAVWGLTSPAEAVSTTRHPGLWCPGEGDELLTQAVGLGIAKSEPSNGGDDFSIQVIGVGITKFESLNGGDEFSAQVVGLGTSKSEPSNGQVARTPGAHLSNSRRKLRRTLLDYYPLQEKVHCPVVIKSDTRSTGPGARSQRNKRKAPGSRRIKRFPFDLEPINEAPEGPSADPDEEMEALHTHPGYQMGQEALVSYRSSNSSFWTITVPSGSRYTMEWVPSDDGPSIQIAENNLNALYRIRGLPFVAFLESMSDRRTDKYLFMKWMGDMPLKQTFRNGVAHSLASTTEDIARLLHSIQAMHMRGVIHGKIAVDRIMVGERGELTLFDFTSSTITNHCAAINCDVPLWIPDEKRTIGGNMCKMRSPYFDDYAGLAHIWHEMRTLKEPTHLGFGIYKFSEDLLSKHEASFMRRMFSKRQEIRFNSVEEIKAHPVFKQIDWSGA